MSRDKDYDVIVIGAGHNGLVCANYLAKAGCKVIVLERRAVVGGASATEEMFGGYKIDVGSAVHTLIHETGIIDDLKLEKFGLKYLQLDPFAFAPFPDGTYLRFYRDLDKTCEEIEKVSPKDAEAYKKFVEDWTELNRILTATFTSKPSAPSMSYKALSKDIVSLLKMTARRSLQDRIHQLLMDYGKLLSMTFESEYVKAPLAFLAAQAGVSPSTPGTANFAGWHALSHSTGVTRPQGGSGKLSEALQESLINMGGEVRLDTEVTGILIRNDRAIGVETSYGEKLSSDIVISSIAPVKTLLELLPSEALNDNLRRKISSIKISPISGVYIRGIATNLPEYKAVGGSNNKDHYRGMQLLCPTLSDLEKGFQEAAIGNKPSKPAVYLLTPSVVDPSLAPEKHLVYIWAQPYPLQLAGGQSWDDATQDVVADIFNAASEYIEGLEDIITKYRVIRTPPQLAGDLQLPYSNIMHGDMTIDQLFFMRPIPELSGYRTPIKGLYLTGAGTHPGGGVQGAAGKNTAEVILADMTKAKRWIKPALVVAGSSIAFAVLRRSARASN